MTTALDACREAIAWFEKFKGCRIIVPGKKFEDTAFTLEEPAFVSTARRAIAEHEGCGFVAPIRKIDDAADLAAHLAAKDPGFDGKTVFTEPPVQHRPFRFVGEWVVKADGTVERHPVDHPGSGAGVTKEAGT